MHRLVRVVVMFLTLMPFLFPSCLGFSGYLLPHHKLPYTSVTSDSPRYRLCSGLHSLIRLCGDVSPGSIAVGGIAAGLGGPLEMAHTWLASGAVSWSSARALPRGPWTWTLSIWSSSPAGASSQHVGCFQG